jgi:structural maintenance of chromosome 3 (chondroitin sulfate proteoglycan 6)
MQQLSGGEKTIVVIAFIIAIQRADPAPFYVFDELDAALDPQKGFTLANLITRSAKNAQFIMTTFKPELCKNADKVFEVRFRNRASEIRSIERERAFEVIQNEGNERAFN